MFVTIATSDDIAYMVFQGLQGRQELKKGLPIEHGGQRDVHGDGVLGVQAGHTHCRVLL